MKVMEMRDAWGVEHIKPGTRPDRSPGPGEVLIRMQAASVNYRDLVMTQRGYGRHSGELPLVLLSDGAGTVAQTGPGVTRVRVGDLVCPAFAQSWFSGPLREEHRPFMLGGPQAYDVVTCAATLIHFGDLGPAFAAAGFARTVAIVSSILRNWPPMAALNPST